MLRRSSPARTHNIGWFIRTRQLRECGAVQVMKEGKEDNLHQETASEKS
jgi:hypothetical protein